MIQVVPRQFGIGRMIQPHLLGAVLLLLEQQLLTDLLFLILTSMICHMMFDCKPMLLIALHYQPFMFVLKLRSETYAVTNNLNKLVQNTNATVHASARALTARVLRLSAS